MHKVKEYNVEMFYDCLDALSTTLYNYTKNSYLECLLYASQFIYNGEISEDIEDQKVYSELEDIIARLNNKTMNKEEIRKAFQIAMLKGFKQLNQTVSDITPDSIGILVAYFVDKFLSNKEEITILDPNIGTGNLLFSMLNNTKISFKELYGIDINYNYMEIALNLSKLLDINIEFYHQNNLKPLMTPLSDLIISDLPIDDENDWIPKYLKTAQNKIKYKPYLMIEHFMKYGKEGSYFIYLIPNNFFVYENNEIMKNIIFSETHVQAIIQLPENLFKDKSHQKSILILQKKGEDIKPTKEVLMLLFPDFSDKVRVSKAIDKINAWFENINNN